MKKLNYLLLFFSILSFAQQPQDSIRIIGTITNNVKFAKVVVKKFGIGSIDIAAVPIKNKTFKITAPLDIEAGVYRLQYSQASLHEYVDVIIDGKEKIISFEIDVNKPEKLPVFTQSEENKKWYNYKETAQNQLKKIDLISQFINQYPATKDLILSQSKIAYEKEITIYKTNFKNFIAQNPTTWAANLVANSPAHFANPTDLIKIQDYNKRNNYWKNINCNNPKLINTPLYTEHILDYLKYYMNPEMGFGEEEMTEGFKKSTDTILKKFSGNEATKKFAIKYLQLGFKDIGQEKVLQYIDQKYTALVQQCTDEIEKEAFDKRMAGYLAMKEGTQAPEIEYTDSQGNKKTLTSIDADKTIVVFWASWCPHCIESMPKVNDWASANPSTKILAISLDDSPTEYEKATAKLPNMIHFSDYKKWQGKAVNEYYIAATPTFIILDKTKKILGKFASWESAAQFLK